MQELKKGILNCLREIKGSGKFASIHTADFLFPGLVVDGLGEVAYPVNALQAEKLIKAARKAPFGKGRETIVDTDVRSTWEIDAEQLTFTNPAWDGFLAKTIQNIKSDLGLEDYVISAHLYKMLIYEKGDFFLPHKDSEKEKGMFGTLIIGLPAQHTGGELVIGFEGDRETADFAEANNNHAIKYAAFYADCEHEIKPLTSGHRVCLVYNLIQEKAGKTIAPHSLNDHAHKLADVFSKAEQSHHHGPYVILLGHQYTPENFSREALKLDDRSKAEALLQAAEIKGYYAKLCLVTSYKTGLPESDDYGYRGYRGYGYDSEDESAESLEMAEVYDEDLHIEHWGKDMLPGFDQIELVENELITSFELDDGEPVTKENSGYMGNYGPELMYWYHYGAIMIWSTEQNAEMLLSQNTKTQLQWIDHFTQTSAISASELIAVEQILLTSFADREPADYNTIAKWLIQRKSEHFLLKLSAERLQLFFELIDAVNWTKLLGNLPNDDINTLLNRAAAKITKPVLEKIIGIIKAAAGNAALELAAAELTKRLPAYIQSVTAENKNGIGAEALSDLLWIFHRHALVDSLVEATAEALMIQARKTYVRDVLIPIIVATKAPSMLSDRLTSTCKAFIQKLVSNKPEPPADWIRTWPETSSYRKQWSMLKAFLASPDEITFDFSRNENERTVMENAIRSGKADLRTETIKKGRPYTLRIIKTQASYERALKQWKQDVALLASLERNE